MAKAKKATTRKRSAKKSATRRPAAKKSASRKPSARRSTAKKSAAKRKPAARKSAAKRSPRITTEQATRFIKQEAERQPIRVELSEEQARAVLQAWNDLDPKKAARVTFVVQGRAVSDFSVAAYRYRGDTCCV